jgi:hypothetical protein
MSDALITAPSAADTIALLQQQNQSKYGTSKALAQVTKAGDYLPYLQALGSNSPEVQEGKFQMGHIVLSKGKAKSDLGTSIIAMLLAWRPKAMQFKPSIQNYYNPDSEAFKRIEIESMQPNSGKAYGPEFLVWLPEYKEIATVFFGSATGRVEAPNIISALTNGKVFARLACELIEYKKQSKKYHGWRYYPYDVPVTVMPPHDQLQDVLSKFCNPPETEAAPAEKAEAGDDRG